MKEIITGRGRFLFRHVKNGVVDCEFVHVYHGEDVCRCYNADHEEIDCFNLPAYADSYTFITTSKGASEEDSAKIVDAPDMQSYYGIPLFTNFLKPRNWNETLASATDSLNSLLTANGLDVNKNYAILEIKQ